MNIKEINDTKLQEAIARFESMHGAIEEVCPWFVGAIVEFTQKTSKVLQVDDWVNVILNRYIYENGLGPVVSGDEFDALITEIVRAIVT